MFPVFARWKVMAIFCSVSLDTKLINYSKCILYFVLCILCIQA